MTFLGLLTVMKARAGSKEMCWVSPDDASLYPGGYAPETNSQPAGRVVYTQRQLERLKGTHSVLMPRGQADIRSAIQFRPNETVMCYMGNIHVAKAGRASPNSSR